MIISGMALYFGIETPRALHRLLAPLFAMILIAMMATGIIMYFPGFFSRKKFKIRLLKKETVASGTMAFYFTKPLGYKYTAGQYADWTIDGLTHTFSLASAPFEKELMIATRIRPSEFKNRLKDMRPGDTINVSPAAGSFVLGHEEKSVFIAGGIGITPFYSMLKQYPNRNTILIYSNRTPEEAAFLKGLKAINIFTKKEGHLTWEKIKKLTPAGATYYLAGPPAFVNALKRPGIKTEEFSGY